MNPTPEDYARMENSPVLKKLLDDMPDFISYTETYDLAKDAYLVGMMEERERKKTPEEIRDIVEKNLHLIRCEECRHYEQHLVMGTCHETGNYISKLLPTFYGCKYFERRA